MTVRIRCRACHGHGCTSCHGGGHLFVKRTIEEILNWPRLRAYLETYHFWAAQGVMPVAGALLDQSQTWLAATTILDTSVTRVQRERAERSRKK